MKLVTAWDLDGTLIDSSHRTKVEDGVFNLDYWKEKALIKEEVFKDKLLPLADLYREFSKTNMIQICVTARAMNQNDFEFLEHHKLEFDMILHRKDSLELDEILKNKRLNQYFEDKQFLPFQAFDDKQENLEIFDKFGFRTFHASYMNEKLKAKKYSEFQLSPGIFI